MVSAVARRLRATTRVWRRGDLAFRLLADGLADHKDDLAGCSHEPSVAAPSVAPATEGMVNSPVSGALIVTSLLRVHGWVVFATGPAVRIDIELGGRAVGSARLGIWRPDAGEYRASPLAALGGFEHVVDLSLVPVRLGATTLQVVAHGAADETWSAPPVELYLRPQQAAPERDARPVPGRLGRARHRLGARPRVLLATHRLDLGGGQLHLLDLVKALSLVSDFELSVLSFADGTLRQDFEELGIPVHVTAEATGNDPVVYDGRTSELSAWVRQGHFDAAIVNTACAYQAADAVHRAGVPMAWVIHESYSPTALQDEMWLSREVGARFMTALRGSTCLVFVADATRMLYDEVVRERAVTVP